MKVDRNELEANIGEIDTQIKHHEDVITQLRMQREWLSTGLDLFAVFPPNGNGSDTADPIRLSGKVSPSAEVVEEEVERHARGRGPWGHDHVMQLEHVRDAVVFLGRRPPPSMIKQAPGSMTKSQIAKYLRCSPTSQRLQGFINTLEESGVLRSMKYRVGKQYFYVDAKTCSDGLPPASRESRFFMASAPVDGTGRIPMGTGKENAHILRKLSRQEFEISHTDGGHVKVTNRITKAFVTLPNSPSKSGTVKTISQLRGIGAPV